jgi:protocatechuate 3,4-dioxygenase beta subunit
MMMSNGSARLAAALMGALAPTVMAQTGTVAPADAPSSVSLVAAGEPGTPLRISGTVVTGPERRPVANASIYVYQTDAGGRYDPTDPRASDRPRIRGFLRTDARGRYAFTTIRPGPYPNTANPGHIHYHVSAPDHPEKVFEIVFEGDPLIPAQWLRDAASERAAVAVVRLERDGAGLRGVHDVVLRPARS